MKKGRSIRKYTKEFREGALTLALKSPSIANTAPDFSVSSLQ